MQNSLMKFANRTDAGDGRQLYWGRAATDGLPFRGRHAPTLTEDEFEERTVRVADPKHGTFDTSIAAENKAILHVVDGVANGWYQLLFIERWREEGSKHHIVYCEWLEYFLEDGSKALAMNHQPWEVAHGQPSISPHLGTTPGQPPQQGV